MTVDPMTWPKLRPAKVSSESDEGRRASPIITCLVVRPLARAARMKSCCSVLIKSTRRTRVKSPMSGNTMVEHWKGSVAEVLDDSGVGQAGPLRAWKELPLVRHDEDQRETDQEARSGQDPEARRAETPVDPPSRVPGTDQRERNRDEQCEQQRHDGQLQAHREGTRNWIPRPAGSGESQSRRGRRAGHCRPIRDSGSRSACQTRASCTSS